VTSSSTRNTTNSTCAIQVNVPAIPEKPSTALTRARTRNRKAQYSIVTHPLDVPLELVDSELVAERVVYCLLEVRAQLVDALAELP
jgi:hypothetical protein